MPVLSELAKAERSTTQQEEARRSLRWWAQDPEKVHESVWTVADRIWQNLSARRMEFYYYSMMYNQVDLLSRYQSAGFAARNWSEPWGANSMLRLNVLQNVIDTAASMIVKNRPKPLFLTDGADYQTYMKADKLTRYVGGVFEQLKFYEKFERVFTDAAVGGTGYLKWYADEEEGRICCEWVFPNEVLIDELEGMRETPTQIHQKRLVPREELLECYHDFEEQIMELSNDAASDARSVADVLPVVESWHLRSGPNAKDGKHAICIENATLLFEDYKKDYYPIQPWRWYHSTLGFHGRGIGAEIGGLQRSIDSLLRTIEEAQQLFGVPMWLVHKLAKVNDDHILNNEMGRIIEWSGEQPPQVVTPASMAPDIYQHVWRLVQEAYAVVGINQSMAQGQKQPGLESGAAIREATDVASGRLQVIGQRAEGYVVEAAKIVVDLSKDLYGSDKDLSMTVKNTYGDGLKRIKWGDVDMEEDRFKIEVFPVSGLPHTPAGRLQAVMDLKAAGVIPNEVVMSLLNMPDLKRYTDLETATQDLVQATCGLIKDEERYKPEWKPIPQLNLQLALGVATRECALAKLQGCSQEVLDLLTLYTEDIHRELTLQTPPPPAPAPGPLGMPPAAPVTPMMPPGPPMPQPAPNGAPIQ